ncbi:putative alpha subunit of casein kinase II [Monocercomonoides exilis]|uniref:putative alpha subunit of casein kinase II n=1 Tax=Monocercomonoides exilis TaxID=2049356 RepID=UPI00355A71E1|nr:putative alpha subunit of casein kinase II [Monocercomonoides exilis]|eukprot:MONOS_5114.1-p1 / transcript=MONOS_5114.1 / gene=MONOS_5114 / organism=Monocercomonoides_exilis_PA203 / gene_product=DEHA2A13662p / transcript_product=DEHA2A13662p / location=Mono_scaffold00145:63862-65681(-) / protein_length=487 / sequence_SO=supercontig / SO=protein_coding / is_pseudo=false
MSKAGDKIPKWRQSQARYYANALDAFPSSFSDPDTVAIVPHSCEPYELMKKIGHGKFGEVFEGIDIHTGRMCAVKVLRPVKKKKLQRELKVLASIDGGPNIVQLYDIVRDPDSRMYSFIYEEVDNDDFKDLYPKLQPPEIRFYLYQILKALDFSHSRGIMHRDIKPHNIMIDHSKHQLRVIDWGLAEYYRPLTEYNVRVASRHYKGPELLTNMKNYDYSLDMWSLGCIVASLLFQKMPFFRGRDDPDQLVKITQVLGTEELENYIRKYELPFELTPELKGCEKKEWTSFITPECAHLCSADGIDLVDHLLRFDHQERLSAKEAMNHTFFDEVRQFDDVNLSCGREIAVFPEKLMMLLMDEREREKEREREMGIMPGSAASAVETRLEDALIRDLMTPPSQLPSMAHSSSSSSSSSSSADQSSLQSANPFAFDYLDRVAYRNLIEDMKRKKEGKGGDRDVERDSERPGGEDESKRESEDMKRKGDFKN